MYDLYLDILFIRTRQQELALEVAIQALLRQARHDTHSRRGHMLLAMRDCLRALGLSFGARHTPSSHHLDVIPVHASDTQHGVAPQSAAATQESSAREGR
jgi:hypothetical protein